MNTQAPFTPPVIFLLYVARLCTVKTLVGVPTAVALMLLVDCTFGHIFSKCDHKLYADEPSASGAAVFSRR